MEPFPVIAARQLAIGYSHGKNGSTVVHRDLSFDLWAGELTCLLGPNGAGKSTLLRTLSAFQLPLEGELWLEGRPLRDYSEREKSRKIGVVLTDKTQAGGLTVYELVSLGRQPHTGFWGRLNREDHKLVEEALTAVGISHKAANYVAELSDGERQKVMIAKALVQECPLIILDEPTAFLDVVSRIEIMTLLHQLAVEQNKAILLSTHDIEQALVLSDKLWLLSKETGLQCGVTEDMILNHRMDTLFSHSNIRFDYNHGIYYPTVTGKKEIRVEAENDTLLHWTINALNRHGYTCLPANQGNRFLPYLQALSDHRLILTQKEETHTYSSFEEVLAQLI